MALLDKDVPGRSNQKSLELALVTFGATTCHNFGQVWHLDLVHDYDDLCNALQKHPLSSMKYESWQH